MSLVKAAGVDPIFLDDEGQFLLLAMVKCPNSTQGQMDYKMKKSNHDR